MFKEVVDSFSSKCVGEGLPEPHYGTDNNEELEEVVQSDTSRGFPSKFSVGVNQAVQHLSSIRAPPTQPEDWHDLIMVIRAFTMMLIFVLCRLDPFGCS